MKRFLFGFCAVVFSTAFLLAEDIIRYQGPEASMTIRQQWALREASKKVKPPFWVAYSITAVMHQNEFIGTFYTNGSNRPTLQEMILGGTFLTAAPENRKGRGLKINKEVAFLFLYRQSEAEPERIEISTLDLHFNTDGYALIWLGHAQSGESIQYLSDLYRKFGDEKRKQEVIEAIGSHKSPEAVTILQSALKESSEGIRAQAALWLGFTDNPEALNILTKFVEKEHSEEVLNEALAGINEMEDPAGTAQLISWAEKSQNRELRKQAIFWLGQKAIANIQNKIKDYAFNDKDTEIQKQAVVALAEMEGNAGLPQLIEIAKTHPNPEVRKHAIIFLGDSGDPRARQAILEILRLSQK